MINWNNYNSNWKKLLGFRNLQKKVRNFFFFAIFLQKISTSHCHISVLGNSRRLLLSVFFGSEKSRIALQTAESKEKGMNRKLLLLSFLLTFEVILLMPTYNDQT